MWVFFKFSQDVRVTQKYNTNYKKISLTILQINKIIAMNDME